MLENVNVEVIVLEEGKFYSKVLVTLKNNGIQSSFIKVYSDIVPDKINIINDLIMDGSYVKEGFKKFEERFNKFLTLKELEDYYKDCVLINKKLSQLFGNYVEQWG